MPGAYWPIAGRPVIFTMARLDRIKNITGLVSWYAEHPDAAQAGQPGGGGRRRGSRHSDDREEQAQIERMHALFDEHGLDGCVRWLGVRLDKTVSGEIYRCIADHRGVFVQPALFEAFGLTVIEAMASGLPTFATRYGGPLEIIEHGRERLSHRPQPRRGRRHAMAEFLARCAADPAHWDAISRAAISRVEERYTWRLYAQRMMTLSRIYGFWKYVTNLERAETRRYLEMFHTLQFRPMALLK
jgi:sucrose synthase